MQRDLASMLQQKSRLAALGLAVSKINHDLRNLLASAQLFSDRLASLPDPRVQRFAPKLMRALERAIAFCQSTLSYGRAQEPPPDRRHDPARAAGRGGARDARPRPRRADPLDQRGRARPHGRCRSRPAVPHPAQPRAQRRAGARKPRRPNDPGRDQIRITGRREGAVVVIEVSDTGPGISGQGARPSVRGVPGLDPHRRHRARALPSPPSWCAPMAARSAWSKAPSARPSASPSPTARSTGIEHRYSSLLPQGDPDSDIIDADAFYIRGEFPDHRHAHALCFEQDLPAAGAGRGREPESWRRSRPDHPCADYLLH